MPKVKTRSAKRSKQFLLTPRVVRPLTLTLLPLAYPTPSRDAKLGLVRLKFIEFAVLAELPDPKLDNFDQV